MKPNIELHIEELVLHGFSPSDRYRIAEAIERELVQLFSRQSAPPALLGGGEIAYVDAGALQMQPGAGLDAIGAQVARAVYGGLRAGAYRGNSSSPQMAATRETSSRNSLASREKGRGL